MCDLLWGCILSNGHPSYFKRQLAVWFWLAKAKVVHFVGWCVLFILLNCLTLVTLFSPPKKSNNRNCSPQDLILLPSCRSVKIILCRLLLDNTLQQNLQGRKQSFGRICPEQTMLSRTYIANRPASLQAAGDLLKLNGTESFSSNSFTVMRLKPTKLHLLRWQFSANFWFAIFCLAESCMLHVWSISLNSCYCRFSFSPRKYYTFLVLFTHISFLFWDCVLFIYR